VRSFYAGLERLAVTAGRVDEATLLGDAIHQYFKARAASSRRTLRELFRRGRISLLIALAFLAASLALGDLIENISESGFAALLREGLLIGGWVAMWRPLKVLLYDWWPLIQTRKHIVRILAAQVEVRAAERTSTPGRKH